MEIVCSFSNLEVHISCYRVCFHIVIFDREYAIGDFVAAVYEFDHLVYIGTVVEIDESDNEVLVSFMEPSVVFKDLYVI